MESTAEAKRIERNRKNTERIKKRYSEDPEFRDKMKENSKKRYSEMKEIVRKATDAGLLTQS
jgi:hypothetical protein